MVVYYDNSVPTETIDKLKELGVITVDMSENTLYGMFWRFFALDLFDCEGTFHKSIILVMEKGL